MAETAATYSVPEHHVFMFTTNVRGVLAKKGGDLMDKVTRGAYTGSKVQVVDFIGPITFTERKSPYGDTKLTELDHTSRWISGSEMDAAVLVDRMDQLKMIYDPTSPYVERFREAAARVQDNKIMEKFFATAKTGKEGTTDVAFPNSDIIVHGSTGMTIAKLRAARKMMKKRHVDLRGVKPFIAVTAEQADQLLGETEVKSADYNAVKPLVDGDVSTFMGFLFVPFEDYAGVGIPSHMDTGVKIRDLPVWVPDGMHYGSWQELAITINNRPDKNNIPQIHGTFTCGATRIEEGKVLQLQVTET